MELRVGGDATSIKVLDRKLSMVSQKRGDLVSILLHIDLYYIASHIIPR